ncbi:MAG: nucleoid occlusion protein [Candidatus Spyradocola sp.]|nr:nucleoid occlusion protein [Candidatus Spyradocola sp.]
MQAQSTTNRRNLRMREREVARIPIDSIRPNPYQPRRVFSQEALEELCASIKQYGLLQPISVRKTGNDTFELIAGERRLRASKMAGMKYIDAIIFSTYEQDSAVIAMMENLQRENLHYMEEAEGYQNLIRDHGLSQDELARRLGKNQSTIANKMRILKLPMPVKRMLLQYNLTERHARALLRLHDEEAQIKVIQIIVAQGLNVKATEDLVERTISRMYGIAEEEESEKKPSRISGFVRDTRLFVNSIRTIVQQMTDAGLAPRFDASEQENGVDIHIWVPNVHTK